MTMKAVPLVLAGVEGGDDVGVGEAGGGDGLAAEPLHERLVGRPGGGGGSSPRSGG